MSLNQNILVADSDERCQEQLRAVLESEGFHVTSTTKGKEALEALRLNSISFIIIDTCLLDMKGIELIWQIKGLDPDCPLLVTTGDPSAESEIQAREAGILYYARKPFNVEHVLSVIKRSLQKQTKMSGIHA
jgi:DNA-binding NtrC family response regulator